jgi:hypothetical protein
VKVTVPSFTGELDVTVALSITDWLLVLNVVVAFAAVVVVLVFGLNVTVTELFGPSTFVHVGLVVQVVNPLPEVQLTKKEDPFDVAVSVTFAPLTELLRLVQVLLIVTEVVPLPVPVQALAPFVLNDKVPASTLIVTEPPPVPAKVTVKFRASVNAVCAVKPED